MSYTPNMPLAGYTPRPTSTDGATDQDFLDMLPPLSMANLQMDLGYLLGTVHYGQLGEYGSNYFKDQRVDAPLKKFQDELKNIGMTIKTRNQARLKYDFLLPAGIPQSINI